MKQHIKGIRITFIFMICFYVFPSFCFGYPFVESGFVTMNGDPTHAYKIKYTYYIQTQSQLPIISWDLSNALTIDPIKGSTVETITHRGWFTIEQYDCTINTQWPIATNLQWGSIPVSLNNNCFTDAKFNQLVADFNSYPAVCPAPVLCDQTAIDLADASCPFGTGSSSCDVNSNLVTVCDTCADITASQLEPIARAWGDANCEGGSKYLTTYNCETSSGICNEPSCNELLADCINKCSNNIVPDSFSCIGDPGNLITTLCECVGQASSPSHSTDLPTYEYDELTGEISLNGTPVGSNSTTPEQATVQNTSAINDNISHQTETINNALTNITNSVTNTSTTTNNSLTNVDNSVKKVTTQLGTLDTNLGAKLDDISSKLESTVDYNPSTPSNDYTYSDNATGQFKTRFNTFVTDLKATPLFSLPNQVLFSIPDSTTSIYSFDMGSYGHFDFDFANYATPLLILRTCFLICFSYAGLRIVVSKK